MKEIGGYLEFEKLVYKPYYSEMIELNTARNAVIYYLSLKKFEKIFIPEFLCDSISKVLIRYKFHYETYKIDINFLPVFDKIVKDNELLLIVNYYGQLSEQTLASFKNQWNNILIDNSQAFFQKPIKGIDCFYSPRKFFGVPDGAYLYARSIQEKKLSLNHDSSAERMWPLIGRYEDDAANYWNNFKSNQTLFEYLDVMQMSKLTKNLLGAIDYESAKTKREQNYAILESDLHSINQLSLKPFIEGPFAYPLYVENAHEIRKKLVKRKIYIPVLWPNVLIEYNSIELSHKYAYNILPLPCDQRYDTTDMKRLIKEIRLCIDLEK